jgi:hypothetical protein
VVTLTGTQTLTNKTLTTPNIDSAQFATVSGTAPIYPCRAWVNFDGTTSTGGFCTVRASGNVTSVADNGTGDFTITFTTAMPDVNYCPISVSQTINNTRGGTLSGENQTSILKTTTQLRILTMAMSSATADATVSDSAINNVAIFR